MKEIERKINKILKIATELFELGDSLEQQTGLNIISWSDFFIGKRIHIDDDCALLFAKKNKLKYDLNYDRSKDYFYSRFFLYENKFYLLTEK
jgi:hypothetical protein